MKQFELNEQILLQDKYKINADELLFISIILLIQDGDKSEFINNYLKLSGDSRGSIIDLITSLQHKGIITKEYKIPKKGEKFIPEDITFNKNFVKNFFKASFDLGISLWESYPLFATIQGSTVGIRSISKKYNSPEDAYRAYAKAIKYKPDIHEHILELLEWGKENNLINYTLASFIVDRRWEELEAFKNGDLANINFEAVKLI